MKIPVFFCCLLAALPAAAEIPLTLEQAHAIALRNHPQVQIAQLRSEISRAVLRQDQAAYLPTADAYFDAVQAGNANTRILAGGLNSSEIYDRVADGVAIDELITDFGQTPNRVAGARLEAKAENANAAAVDQEVLLNVDVAYFGAQQAQAVLAVARATVQARQTLLDQVSAMEKSRLKSALDLSFAQVALEESRLLLQKAEGDLQGAEAGLSAALGYRETQPFRLAPVPPSSDPTPPADSLIDLAFKNRPDLLRLDYQREADLRLAKAERDRNYPTIAAVGTVGNAITHDNRLPNKYAAGGITVDLPLFDGGADLARLHEAEDQARIAEQTWRDQEDNVARDVRLAWIRLDTARQRRLTSERLLAYADTAYGYAQARYRAGSSSIVELNEAQLSATSAQIGEAEACYDELAARSLLQYQAGILH